MEDLEACGLLIDADEVATFENPQAKNPHSPTRAAGSSQGSQDNCTVQSPPQPNVGTGLFSRSGSGFLRNMMNAKSENAFEPVVMSPGKHARQESAALDVSTFGESKFHVTLLTLCLMISTFVLWFSDLL